MNQLQELKAPTVVNLELTDQCNLKCSFCFCASDEYQHSLSALSSSGKIENLKKILDISAENNIFEIRLFGGEFPLLKGWRSIVEYAYDLNFFISFVSNGTVFSESDIEFLISKQVTTCVISLHGLEAINDQIVGIPGSFKKSTKNIELLLAGGVEVTVLFTPTKVNISHLEEFAKTMIVEYAVTSVGVNRLFRSDRYENLSFADYLYIFSVIEKLQNQSFSVFFTDSFPFCKVPSRYWKYMGNCSQGMSFCQIDYQGNIKNCSSLCVNLGNIFKENIQDIWQEKLAEFRTLKYLPLSCRLCPMFCGGGCIASRAQDKNFVPDEFIKLPEEESLLESLAIIAKNYLKKYYNSLRTRKVVEVKGDWTLEVKPLITRRYRVRKEAKDFYLCLIEKKGIVVLNERSKLILSLIDGKSSVKSIILNVFNQSALHISVKEVAEVLDIFIN